MNNQLREQQNKSATDYHRTTMQKSIVLQLLREKGYRITKQRQLLLDIILQEQCASCKEIYYKASASDPSLGAATVYRMINLLEEIGAIRRNNLYRVSCGANCKANGTCEIVLDDHTIRRLSEREWHQVISEGLRNCGYLNTQKVVSVSMDS